MKGFISGADMQFYTDSKTGMEEGWKDLPAELAPGESVCTFKVFHIPSAGNYALQYRIDSRLHFQITEPAAQALPWRRGLNPERLLHLQKGANRICARIVNNSDQPLPCTLTCRLLDSRGNLVGEPLPDTPTPKLDVVWNPLPSDSAFSDNEAEPDLTGYTPAAGAGFSSCGRFGYAKGDGLLDYSMPAFGVISRPFISGHPKYRSHLLWSFSLLPSGEQETGSRAEVYHVPENETVECDWTHTRWTRRLNDGHFLTFDYSVIAPELLIETDLQELTLSRLEGIGSFRSVTLPLPKGVLTRSCQDGVFYDAATDGALARNWVMFSGSGRFPEVPVLLMLPASPAKILRTEDTVTVCFSQPIGWMMLSFPHGMQLFEPDQLTPQWYTDTVALCAAAHCRALARPTVCREYFQIQDNRVSILNTYEYRYFEDSLQTPSARFAPLPPPVALAQGSVAEITLDPRAVSLEHPTKYGPLYAVPGSCFCRYSLPIPPYRGEFSFHCPDAERMAELLHSDFDEYLQYYRDSEEILNPGNYSFIYQYALAAKRFPVLKPEDLQRLITAMEEGLDVVTNPDFGYIGPSGRRCLSWYRRTEPFTGVSYYSTYLHVSGIRNFAHCDREVIEGTDQTFIEVDWGNAMSLYGTYLAALFTGRWDTVRKHWSVFRRAFDYYLVTMDWACMTAAYAENGITWNDGTNYGGYLGFLNMADLLGMKEDRDLALYAYAKMNAMRMGLFVASQTHFCKYFGVEPWYTAKFFHEETDAGFAFQSYPDDIIKNHYRGQSIYNLTTEGHYEEAMRMYAAYLPGEVEKLLQAAEGATQEDGLSMTGAVNPPLDYHTRLCNLLGQQETYTYLMLSILLDRFPKDTLSKMIDEAYENDRISKVLLGTSASRRRMPKAWTYAMLRGALEGKGLPRIGAWNDLEIRSARYPRIEVVAGKNAWLELSAKKMPRAVLQGQPLTFRPNGPDLWRADIPVSGSIEIIEPL